MGKGTADHGPHIDLAQALGQMPFLMPLLLINGTFPGGPLHKMGQVAKCEKYLREPVKERGRVWGSKRDISV